jgi:hypothetical protein
MKPPKALTHEFVEFIPDMIEEGKLYVSIEYATTVHKCCCGCGKEVVTPLSPTDWKLMFDGKTVSLDPSIGNWSFPCRSHYWVRNNRALWAEDWSQSRIDAARAYDGRAKGNYFAGNEQPGDVVGAARSPEQPATAQKAAWWKKLWPW